MSAPDQQRLMTHMMRCIPQANLIGFHVFNDFFSPTSTGYVNKKNYNTELMLHKSSPVHHAFSPNVFVYLAFIRVVLGSKILATGSNNFSRGNPINPVLFLCALSK